MDNLLEIPFLNPVRFYKVDPALLDKYLTRHFEDWKFEDRILPWQQPEEDIQVWQDDDPIKLQFETNFDPIVVQLIDEEGNILIDLVALVGLPNLNRAGWYSYDVEMPLTGITTGCYHVRILAGLDDVFISPCQYISSIPIPGTILHKYWHSHFHKDVMFETGIKFEYRVHAHTKFLEKIKTEERYRNQKHSPSLLNSKSSRAWPIFYGDEFGLSDDKIDLIHEIWSCDFVELDNKSFALVDGKADYTEIEDYPKRGMNFKIEEGINRNSKIFAVSTDTNKKIISTIMVEVSVFGDTGNTGAGNTVPVHNIQNE